MESEWEPDGITKQPPLIIPAEKNEAEYRIKATAKAKPGSYPLTLTAREYKGGIPKSGSGFHYVNSSFIKLHVSEPYVEVELIRSNIERGQVGKITGKLKHIKKLPGSSEARLINLPFGVVQLKPYPRINSGMKSVDFKLEVTSDCLVDQYKDISCEILIKQNGQVIHQKTGSGVLRVDPERK